MADLDSEEGGEDTGGEGGGAPVDVNVSIEIMLFEAGMIANSLSSKALGAALADRLYSEEQAAEQRQESRLTFSFTPFEAGMALSAMSRSADGALNEPEQRLMQALRQKMQEFDVAPIDAGGGGLGGTDGDSQQDTGEGEGA